MKKTGGIILAAGASSRMGRFKPMLPIEDTTFVKWIIRHMQESGIERIVVITGFRAEELEEHLKDEGVMCVRNERYFETQMLDSVKLGLEQLKEDCTRVLLTPVDAVMSSKKCYKQILKEKGDFVRPIFDGEPGHPVLIRRQLFDWILGYEGDGGLRGAVEASEVLIKELNMEEPAVIMDADTMEDYRRLMAYSDSHRERKLLKSLPEGRKRIRAEVELKFSSDVLLCGEGFMQLMELVDATGSLQKASQAMHMSYTKAWKILKFVEENSTERLICRESGGEAGGGSELTEAGKEFVRRYKAMRHELDETLDALSEKYFEDFYL